MEWKRHMLKINILNDNKQDIAAKVYTLIKSLKEKS